MIHFKLSNSKNLAITYDLFGNLETRKYLGTIAWIKAAPERYKIAVGKFFRGAEVTDIGNVKSEACLSKLGFVKQNASPNFEDVYVWVRNIIISNATKSL